MQSLLRKLQKEDAGQQASDESSAMLKGMN
jgi:hypothetical protein